MTIKPPQRDNCAEKPTRRHVSSTECRNVGTVISASRRQHARVRISRKHSPLFLAVWENAEKAEAGKLKAYLGAIARNKAKNKLRELRAELPLEDDYIIVDDGGSPEDALTENEQRQLVYQAVLEMPSTERDVFLRHYYFCQPVSRISEEMGLGASAVRMRLVRGREKLRAKLNKEANS